jgi:hypothetical protein
LQAYHENLLLPLLSLIAIILELPEEEMLRIVSMRRLKKGNMMSRENASTDGRTTLLFPRRNRRTTQFTQGLMRISTS